MPPANSTMTPPQSSDHRKMHVVVIVLGDLGRSPRMQYHAQSLLKDGHTVSLVGYKGEMLIPALQEAGERLNVVRFSVPSPAIVSKILPVYLLWRITAMCLYLCHALFIAVPKGLKGRNNNNSQQKVDCVLVQNPPAVPLLAVVYFYSLCQGFVYGHRPAMVVDWHNLGFTMLSKTPVFASVARVYEQFMAPRATAHLCVTDAMKTFLVRQFKIPADKVAVLHDCPNVMFQPRSTKENHELLQRLHGKLCAAAPRHWYNRLDPSRQTLFTEIDSNGKFSPRPNRPALVTSSTSWTPDEDFGPLLEALVGLDRQITEEESSLKVMVLVTGKGPKKSYYQQQIYLLKLQHVTIETLWLEPGDYPRLLACADVGVSLHTSTSGIDLPMKILDLFGCQVPVCAVNFQCLSELVEDNVNGTIFQSSAELQEQLWGLLSPLDKYPGAWPPHGFGDLARFSRNLQGRKRWDKEWEEHAKPVFLSTMATIAS